MCPKLVKVNSYIPPLLRTPSLSPPLTLLQVQVANAESDALRSAATTAMHDEQAHSGALQAAMLRIQQLGECVSVSGGVV